METANENKIESVLEQEIALTKKLQSILESERKALSERNPELLLDLVSEKTKLLDEIENNHNLNINIYSEKKSGDFRWEKLIENIPNPKGSLLKKCEEYRKLLEEVEYVNTVNAKTASRMQRSISELINIIRGNTQTQKLYTPKGNSSLANSYTSIAKA